MTEAIFSLVFFWTRLGTPTGEAQSGTVEEIEEFLQRGKPVLLYFSKKPVAPQNIDAMQFEAVRNYKNECMGRGIVSEYEEISELREKLIHGISKIIEELQGEMGAASPGHLDASDELGVALDSFLSEMSRFQRHLAINWEAERDSQPVSIEEAQFILERACDELIEHQSSIQSDDDGDLTTAFSEATQMLKAVQRHRIYLDGGESYQEFWELGDQAVGKVRDVVALLRTTIDKRKELRRSGGE